ncbi:MAG: hypothetical protein ACREYE_23565 [Gammaproteobacteria bacterium]
MDKDQTAQPDMMATVEESNMDVLRKIGPCVVILGAIGLLQAHGIEFWASKLGPYGIAWSLLLEVTALWLWTRSGVWRRVLAGLASGLLLLGPLYQVGTPVLRGLEQAQHKDVVRDREIPEVEAEIRQRLGQLAVFNANSAKRSGWLPAIEKAQANLGAARTKLAKLYREAPRHTSQAAVEGWLVVVMVCIGLVLFQLAAVMAVLQLKAPVKAPPSPVRRRPVRRAATRPRLGRVPNFPALSSDAWR